MSLWFLFISLTRITGSPASVSLKNEKMGDLDIASSLLSSRDDAR
jgi:hypothetical protein